MVATMLLCIVATCWFSSCSDSNELEETILPDPSFAQSRTVMVYMVAENDLSRAAAQDINEMLVGIKNARLYPDNRVVIYLDDVSLPRIYVLDQHTEAARLSDLIPVKQYGQDVNSSSAAVFSDFLEYVKTYYPAESYGLVMWSHASGWIPSMFSGDRKDVNESKKRSFGLDNGKNTSAVSSGNQMNIDDMADALLEQGGCDFMLFDACFMQSIEIAYELRNATKHVIASPAEIPGPGAQYATMLPAMFKRDAYADEMVAAYYNQYSQAGNPYGIVVSSVNTAALPSFSAYMKNLVAIHVEKLFALESRPLLNYYRYEEWGKNNPDYFDMQSVMRQILNNEEFAEWMQEASKVIKLKTAGYWYSNHVKDVIRVDESQCCGVSMFVPRSVYDGQTGHEYNEMFINTSWAHSVWADGSNSQK